MPDQPTAVEQSDQQGSCFKPRKEGRSLPPAQQSFLGPGAAGRVAPAARPLVSQCCRLWGCASTCRPCASCMAPHKSGLGRAENPAQTRRLSAVSNSTILYWSAGQSSCCCENPSAGQSLHACLDQPEAMAFSIPACLSLRASAHCPCLPRMADHQRMHMQLRAVWGPSRDSDRRRLLLRCGGCAHVGLAPPAVRQHGVLRLAAWHEVHVLGRPRKTQRAMEVRGASHDKKVQHWATHTHAAECV